MNTRRHALIASLTALLFVTLTSVTLADVRDNAGFFSEDAVRQANFDLREIKKQYGKDLIVETYPTVPANLQSQLEQEGADAFFPQWARQRGQAAKADGVVVLITKDPSHLQVTPGEKTKARAFTLEDRDRMRDVLVTNFREKNYDQGLLGAVGMFRDTLKRNLGNSGAAVAAPVERSNTGAAQRSDAPRSNPGAFEPSRTQETSRRPGGGGGISFWTILIWGIIILIVVRLIGRLMKRRTHPQQGFDPRRGGVGQPGYDPRVDQGRPGFGGGGFGTGLGGGLLGGLLGGWLGGRMFGHGDSAQGAPPPATPPQEPGVFADQHDSEFAGPGGTFGDAGGGGGDFGGGDSGGGGDFGGGGDSGGGGDF